MQSSRYLSGYIISTKPGIDIENELERTKKIDRSKIEQKIEEIISLSEDLFKATQDVVVRENLMDSLNRLLHDLWQLREYRERELAKLITLIQTITKNNTIDVSNNEQIKALSETIRILRSPKITEIDIKKSSSIIKEARLDIYRPFRNSNNYKLIIQEE